MRAAGEDLGDSTNAHGIRDMFGASNEVTATRNGGQCPPYDCKCWAQVRLEMDLYRARYPLA